MMKQAISVEEWAKEDVVPYMSDLYAIVRKFKFRSLLYENDNEVHQYLCPSGQHGFIQHAYLKCCIQSKELNLLEMALKNGLDVNARYDAGYNYQTPLHVAVDMRNLTVIQALIGHGADINAKDRTGITPLNEAYADESAALLLLKYGAKSYEQEPYITNIGQWILKVERTIQLLGGAPLPTDIIRHIHGFIK